MKTLLARLAVVLALGMAATQAADKPNVLIIRGDDIGQFNVSTCSMGSMGDDRWWVEHMYVIAQAGAYVRTWLQSFPDFPPRRKPGSSNHDRVMEAVMSQQGTGK